MAHRSRIGLLVGSLVLVLAVPAVAVGEGSGATRAGAELRNVAGDTVGWAQFTEDATGILHVNVHVQGLAAGLHGIHIHNTADCTPPFSAAGGHHNPLGATHGDHAGDLPNLIANGAGIGHLDGTTDHATLSAGPVSVFDANGSALIIHAGEDDLHTDPTGNSGGRIACGVIVAG
ncbi:MAG TPA: superoxide dismutase family protein [Candidatus Limnocylindrales bacterium]|nr:superoxide dismutase family protein [Candidatus Limnocylindrales bacterium]